MGPGGRRLPHYVVRGSDQAASSDFSSEACRFDPRGLRQRSLAVGLTSLGKCCRPPVGLSLVASLTLV
jgi:hypothetical protein